MDDDSNMPPTTAATPRLMIEKMVLENFKSYGGQREIGPFHKRFSSIVGPNGSGKSNVIDAMLFVFGKRAKKLRLNKVSELIHKSDTYPDLDWAKVSVHFADVIDLQDGTDAYEVVPGTEVVVSRTAYRDNGSKYQCEVRLEKLNRLRVAEKEREALSSAKAEAEAYVVAEDKIRRQRNTLYQVLRREAAANVALVGERHDELAGRLAEERAKRAAIETSLSGDKAEVAALTKARRRGKAAEGRAKASDGARRDAELREAKKHQEAAARKLEHAAKKDAAVAEEKEGFVAEQERDELPRLNKKVATMSTKADEAEAALEAAREVCKAETTAAQKVLEAKTQADLAPVQDKLSEALSALREVQDELDLTLDGSTAAAKELEAVEAKLGKLEAQAGAKGEELEIHRAKVEALEGSAADLRAKVAGGRSAAAGGARSGRGRPGRRGRQGRARARQADQGAGAVGEVLKAAKGPLKARASAAPRRPRRRDAASRRLPAGATPDGAPRLFDLVTPSHPKYAGAFYMALRDTLVAEDLDEAVKLAYRPTTAVASSTDGKLIDTSGTMSGGGGKAKSGKITLTGGTGGVSRSLRRTGDESRQGAAAAEKASAAAKKADKAAKALADGEDALKDALRQLKRLAELAAAKLEKALASKRKAADAAQAAFDAADADVAELRAAVLDAGGQALKDAVAKAEITRALADDAANEVEAIGVAVKRAKAAGGEGGDKARRRGPPRQARGRGGRGRRARRGPGRPRRRQDEALAACDAAADALAEKRRRLEALSSDADAIKAVEADIETQVDDYARALKENSTKAAHWTKELAKLAKEHAREVADFADADEALAELDKEEVKYAIALLEEERDGMKATVNLKTIAEYRAKQAEYFARLDELEQVTAARNAAREALEALRTKRLDEFMAGFGAITLKLKEMYQMITLGGDAELELLADRLTGVYKTHNVTKTITISPDAFAATLAQARAPAAPSPLRATTNAAVPAA
ncbi:hypothetical protein JL722_8666 [Aureococcus anophagefferens]|nr:hypothetical protein JL722_8666 [Aureococcus anophagefferens]